MGTGSVGNWSTMCIHTMKRFSILPSVLVAVLALGAMVGCASSHSGLEANAKVSKAEATRIALAKAPGGTVKEAELENENGKLVWSFDIATAGSKDITEVQVDAVTGAVVSVDVESPTDQAKEAQEKRLEKK
jgi:hypothetical protein